MRAPSRELRRREGRRRARGLRDARDRAHRPRDARGVLALVALEEWDEGHPRRRELVELIETEGQVEWAFAPAAERHVLVAVADGGPVGFLVFVVQGIGPEDRCPPLGGLTEAKVRAFGVRGEERRQGLGSALQRRLLDRARELGRYQVRSQSDASRTASNALKLRLGFAAHPAVRTIDGEQRAGYYWVKTLSG